METIRSISRDRQPMPKQTNARDIDLAGMSVDELWALHEDIRETLLMRLDAEVHELQRRLTQIKTDVPRPRRPYPKVQPKYRNPERPSETWSGRGMQPHWVRDQLRRGRKFDDLLISRAH